VLWRKSHFKKEQNSYLEWSSETSERVGYIARINHHGKNFLSKKEAPKLRSILSSTTGRKFLVTADRFRVYNSLASVKLILL
jgi:hypothetical protein